MREAVLAANGHNGPDTITLPAGTYKLSPPSSSPGGSLDVSSSLTINGAGATTTIIDGQNGTGLFDGDDNDMTVNGVTLQNGSRGLGGGAITGGGSWTLNNCVVRNNVATPNFGLDVDGGAIRTQDSTPPNRLTINSCTFTDNHAAPTPGAGLAHGGAIFAAPTTPVTITGSTFSGNSASSASTGQDAQGGAIYSGAAGLTMTGGAVSNNRVDATGPAGPSSDGQLADGGGVYSGGPTTIQGTTIDGNTARSLTTDAADLSAARGGGLLVLSAGTVSLTGFTASGNTATGESGADAGGGGVYLGADNPTFTGNTVSGNTAEAAASGTKATAGGVFAEHSLTVRNSTITGNTTDNPAGESSGAGIGAAGASSPVTLRNATLTDNTATGATAFGGNLDRNGPVDAANSIISGGAPEDCPATGMPVIGTYNIDSDGTCVAGGTNQTADPLLGALVDNGGPNFTRLPQAGSPAIDRGLGCEAKDQRGVDRPQGPACDIGAVEVEVPAPPSGGTPTGGTPTGGDTTPAGGSPSGPSGPAGSGQGAGATGPDGIAPVFSGAPRLNPSTFAAATTGGSVRKAATGTQVRYSLSEAATVTFTVERATTGRRAGSRCVKATRKNAKRRRCTRYVRERGSFTQAGNAGANAFRFTGRLRNRTLRPAKYRLVAVAADAAGNKSAAKRTGFRIKRR